MIGVLNSILCVLLQIPYFFLWAITAAFNAVIAALAFVLSGLLLVAPDMPALPLLPSGGPGSEWIGWLNWFFPVNVAITVLTTAAALWLAIQGVVLVLRWAKFVE